MLPTVDSDGAFYSAILNIHRKEWYLAVDYIDAARKAMISRLQHLWLRHKKNVLQVK